ncbi:helix-turn-helix domain-containing protein [Paenibacillus sp. YYML68]|uniref:AraC family transcriptional regulator n=1 Tax=Paenibacillus sp. YYML68 TaxID=2909250 RepID=UPI0024920358|nr:helix-turn-helix domain-containing protein [Paenibacillus sp. YYML68]
MSTAAERPSLGVLKLGEGEQRFRLTRLAPSAEVGCFVMHYWFVQWDLTDQEPYMQEVLPNPCVNAAIEHGRSGIFAPAKERFEYEVTGKGSVFGVKFKPGGFYPFIKQPITTLAAKPLEPSVLFGMEARALEQTLLSLPSEAEMAAWADARLQAVLPEPDETALLVHEVVEAIKSTPDLSRVDQLSERFGLGVRRLQRLFEQYVGVSPKWVIMLYRLQNAAESIETRRVNSMLELSAQLGYHDQSHFIRDFKAVVGRTPEAYARSST